MTLDNLKKAFRKPKVQERLLLEKRHFEQYGDNPIPYEVWEALPEHTKLLYEKPDAK